MTELATAIQTLYDTFARYPRAASIKFCPCGCTKPEEMSPLFAAPLRELAFLDLANFSFSAMLTQGSVDDFGTFFHGYFRVLLMRHIATTRRFSSANLAMQNGLAGRKTKSMR
jgi:hypothetical protein